jgi:hypothetical protein
MRIERRAVESASELTTLVTEVLEGEIKGFRLIDHVEFPGEEIEIGLLAGDAEGRIFIVASREHSGDSLILSYGKHVSWLNSRREVLSAENPEFDWKGEPGLVMLSGSFSPHVLVLASMLGVTPRMCFSMKCLGIGKEKGLYIERIDLPEVTRVAEAMPRRADLLSDAVSGVVGIADDLSISASFGYVSESLDWVPVANVRKRGGTVWVESGPGKWSTKRVEDDASLKSALEKVRASYDEVLRTKGEAKNLSAAELSDAERKSLKWE